MKSLKILNEPGSAYFPVVAFGTASDPQALTEVLQHLPAKTGLAYMCIQKSENKNIEDLISLLKKNTNLPVSEARDGTKLEENHFYVIPHNQFFSFDDGQFVQRKAPAAFSKTPINKTFESLAETYQERTIGILLSDIDSDGMLGLKTIKAAGGITMALNKIIPSQNKTNGVGADEPVDMVLSTSGIAEELVAISRKKGLLYTAIKELNETAIDNKDEELIKILQLLHRSTGADFSQYKMNTIKRRIIRRMMLFKLEYLKDYTDYLRQNANEVNFLYQDLLINVTNFFRDEEACDYLSKVILPKIIKSKSPSDPIRVWVPACSTGQEAYSLAMLLLENLGDKAANTPLQIFATDLSETAINKARLGVYSKDDVLEVPTKRLNRFFTKIDGHYRIVKSIRDLCVFANHNVTKDPPFSRLDIISCCNLLIYLDSALQKKLLATFHYSLNSNGYLVLGKSESVGASAYLFSQVDKKVKIFAKKKEATPKALFEVSLRAGEQERYQNAARDKFVQKNKNDEAELEKEVDDLFLKKYTPASVIVNTDLDILQFRGSTGLYLEPAPGKASLNLMKMAKQGLGFELRNIVHKAKKTGQPARKGGLEISHDGKTHNVSIEAVPLKIDAENEYFLVIFEEAKAVLPEELSGTIKDKRVQQLEAELKALREDMRSIIEAQEAANEELQSANEEIVSSNEELQSINEELETSKEEIESSNEELITINQELQVRNEELAEVQEYAEAVFTTIREGLLILDKELRVKTANRAFYKTFQLREEDVEGRLVYELGNRQWDIPQLKELLEDILPNNSQFQGFELVHHFPGIGEKIMLINARKIVQKIHNQQLVLLAIEDITEHRQGEKIIANREAWFRHMADNVPVMIWVTGTDKLCHFVNKTLLKFRGATLENIIGKKWFEGAHPDDLERCDKTYELCFEEKKAFDIEYRLRFNDGSYRRVLSKAKPNYTHDGLFTGFIGSCVEI